MTKRKIKAGKKSYFVETTGNKNPENQIWVLVPKGFKVESRVIYETTIKLK